MIASIFSTFLGAEIELVSSLAQTGLALTVWHRLGSKPQSFHTRVAHTQLHTEPLMGALGINSGSCTFMDST